MTRGRLLLVPLSPAFSPAAIAAALATCMVAAMLSLATPLPGQSAISSTAAGGTATTPSAIVAPEVLSAAGDEVEVIVQKRASAGHGPEAAVAELGGTFTRDLPLIDGFAATVPTTSISELAATPGIRVISLDGKVRMEEVNSEYGTTKSPYTKVVGSHPLQGDGITGDGVTVAVIDTGVTEVADLAGRIVEVTNDNGESQACANFSGEETCDDSYGHGTFVAGIIAGDGASSNGKWKGAAPGADILSVKIAGYDGSADVSTLLAAIQWTVSYRERYGIQVLNLSLGTDSSQSAQTDPLNYAVQKAWDAGIVVVVSAANLGPDAQTIAKPGDDPLVITVGATDDQGTVNPNDDAVPNFASRGPTKADGLTKPDITAPGAHIISLRAPGSAVDELFPWYVDDAYRRGSGTSFSAAIVSGSVAQILQANPSWAPDRVKHAVKATAAETNASDDPMVVGAGLLAVDVAVTAAEGYSNRGVTRSSGLGTLDASRGTVSVKVIAEDPDGTLIETILTGALTAQLLLYDPVSFTGYEWTAETWAISQWYGSNWNGSNWNGSNWNGSNWNGSNWNSTKKYGSNWNGSNWNGVWS